MHYEYLMKIFARRNDENMLPDIISISVLINKNYDDDVFGLNYITNKTKVL